MADESIHEKLERVRKPHVHIKYEVFRPDGGMEERELPFVVGVMGDFSGNPTEPLKPLKEREFLQIDRDNFTQIMSRMNVGLNLRVKNTIAGDGSETPVQLKFKSMDDFSPANVAKQVPALNDLLTAREQLNTLLSSAERSSKLEETLEEILKRTADAKKAAGGSADSKGGGN